MRRAIRFLFCFALMLATTSLSARAENRLALVIGIDQYANLSQELQLKNAVSDAETLEKALKRLGFSVVLARNPTLDQMIESVNDLAGKVAANDTVLFFFSGHGMRPDSVNLLLPSDFPAIKGDSPADRERARRSAFAEDDVIAKIRDKLIDAKTGQQEGLVIFISDACRDNPFAKATDQGTKSLVRVSHGVEAKPTQGVFSIYSAGLGQTALDRLSGSDKNSVFMTEFVKYLPTPGRHLDDIMGEVKEEVASKAQSVIDEQTGKPHVQVPAIYDETIGGRIFLAGRSIEVEAKEPPKPVTPTPVVPPSKGAEPGKSEQDVDLAYLNCVEKDDADCYKQFLRDFPNHPKAEQAETLLRAKTELPRYQACVDGTSPSERLRYCDLYIDAFPSGKYDNEAKTLRDQALLDLRPAPQPAPAPVAPPRLPPPPPQQPQAYPSFSCAKASLPAEFTICSSATLASLDLQLAELYAGGSGSRSVRAEQRSWLDRRNACGSDTSCLEQRYRERIGSLQGGGQAESSAGPSFSCAKASLAAERAICSSPLLAGLDVQISELYASAKMSGRASYYTKKQRAWMDRRNACGSNASCLEQRYREQIGFLQSAN
ncbi:caspase family protein [Methyloceanibacter sp.]|uniref:caspase family protein n=1 Tax=Methyloceanibacter sp. TaxID=1965321 RepID=UPI003D6CE4DD